MATSALRLRRALTLSSSFLHHSLHRPTPSHPFTTTGKALISQTATTSVNPSFPPPSSRLFTSTTISLSSRDRSFDRNSDEIGPDTILFEGCDYKHWLIVIDFPKDPEPSRDEMISFYEQTAAKIFGSLEEAKQKIYACSTTTYKGFQVECSEETSEKFSGLPGVIFVLPDSYIDPVNKEYGGDKYINGQIIPRPPPVQYGRQGPRRDFRSQPSPRGPMQGGQGNYGPPPQQNFGQPPPQQNFGQPPPPQRNFGQPPQQSFGQPPPPQQNFGQPPPPQQNFGQPPPPQQNFGQPPPPQQNFGQPPPPQQNFGQPPSPQQNFGQPPPPQQNFGQRPPPQQNFGQPPPQQSYGQPRPPQPNYGPPQNFPPQQNYGPPGVGEQRGPAPSSNAPGGWDRGNFHPQGQRDFSHADQRSFAGPPPQGGAQEQERGRAYSQNYPAGNPPTDQGRY